MSPTVRARPASAACDDGSDEAGALSGAWRWTTVGVLPVSIAPVASSTAATTATIRPPTAPASMLALRRFTRRDGRSDRLIRRKSRVRRQREQAAQPGDRARALRERTPQRAPVAGRRRLGGAGRGVALLAQQADVARGVGPGCHLQPPLQL